MSTPSRVNWPILIIGLALSGGLVAALASGFGKNPRIVSKGPIGKTAPAFSLMTLSGDAISLPDLQGSPAVLNFWSTWCQPCKIEHPYLLKAAAAYKPRGVIFLGVLYDDDPDAARRFFQQKGYGFPTLYDPAQRISVDYGVTGVPETFVLDRAGVVREKIIGPVYEGQLESILEGLL